MTTPTHAIIAYLIGLILWPISVPIAIVAGSSIGLIHHLLTDRLIFEWFPLDEKYIIRKMLWFVPYYILIAALILFTKKWLLLIAIFVAILPDIVGTSFFYHRNTQTDDLRPHQTVIIEAVMVLFFFVGYAFTNFISLTYALLYIIVTFFVTMYLGYKFGRPNHERINWRF